MTLPAVLDVPEPSAPTPPVLRPINLVTTRLDGAWHYAWRYHRTHGWRLWRSPVFQVADSSVRWVWEAVDGTNTSYWLAIDVVELTTSRSEADFAAGVQARFFVQRAEAALLAAEVELGRMNARLHALNDALGGGGAP